MRLRLHCSRLGSGLYILTDKPMINAPVGGKAKRDLYVSPGEPIGVGGLCPDGVMRLFDGLQLRRFDSRIVYLSGELAPEAEQAERGAIMLD